MTTVWREDRFLVDPAIRRRGHEGLKWVDLSGSIEGCMMTAVLAIGAVQDHRSETAESGGQPTFADARASGELAPVAVMAS
jgi:hypothetical protein